MNHCVPLVIIVTFVFEYIELLVMYYTTTSFKVEGVKLYRLLKDQYTLIEHSVYLLLEYLKCYGLKPQPYQVTWFENNTIYPAIQDLLVCTT